MLFRSFYKLLLYFYHLSFKNSGTHERSLFGFIFKFCFHHSIFWFLSDELWKLKTHFRCFQVIETELWWHFCKYTHNKELMVRPFALSNTVVFFFSFLSFTLGLDHLSLFSSSSSFLFFYYLFIFFPFHVGFWVWLHFFFYSFSLGFWA